MAAYEELTAPDGHRLRAYGARAGSAAPGLVIAHEIFGLNAHVRDLVERFAALGFDVLAPALFDRLERGVELPYDGAGARRGRELRLALGWQSPVDDLMTAARALGPRVSVIGYCWGGSCAYLAACRAEPGRPTCAVAYYGAQIAELLAERPRVPILLHFGATDPLIPPADVEQIRAAVPAAETHVHAAGHGFACDRRADYRSAPAQDALEQTLAFLRRNLTVRIG